MKTNKYIKILLDNGLNVKTISKLNESQIKVLAEKFEAKEAIQTTQQTGYRTVITPGSQANLNVNGTDISVDPSKGITMMSQTKPVGTGEVKEQEVSEKFKSTAQQRFFWKKCDNSKDKKSKWCQLADEFQKDTKNKRLPKKLHPEKTVKVKTEGYEKYLEDSIVEMVDRYINPAMTKSQLINTLNEKVNKSESFMLKKPKRNSMFSQDEGKEMKTMKRPIGKIFSLGEDTKEKTRPDTDTDTKEKDKGKDRKNPYEPKHRPAPKADTREKTRTRPDTDTDTKEKDKGKDRKNPYEPKHRPAPKARKGEYNEQTVAPTKPGTKQPTRPGIKEKDPNKKNPFSPKHSPAPKAGKGSLPNFLKWDKLGVNLK